MKELLSAIIVVDLFVDHHSIHPSFEVLATSKSKKEIENKGRWRKHKKSM